MFFYLVDMTEIHLSSTILEIGDKTSVQVGETTTQMSIAAPVTEGGSATKTRKTSTESILEASMSFTSRATNNNMVEMTNLGLFYILNLLDI